MIPKYWSLSYVIARICYTAYRFRHSQLPWFSPAVIDYLETFLSEEKSGFEWGSGKSTIWLAKRVNHLTSVEHDKSWFERVSSLIVKKKLQNVNLIYVVDPDQYVNQIKNHPEKSLDLIVVDGIDSLRDQCALGALTYLKEGGLILIDDAHRYLPSLSCSPYAIPPHEKPKTKLWEEFLNFVQTWPSLWFTNGVHDTAIWLRQ